MDNAAERPPMISFHGDAVAVAALDYHRVLQHSPLWSGDDGIEPLHHAGGSCFAAGAYAGQLRRR